MTTKTTAEDLKNLSMTGLVDLHNSYEKHELQGIIHKPCTVKTFNSKEKIIERIKFYQDHRKPIELLQDDAAEVGLLMDAAADKLAGVVNGHAERNTITALANRLIMRPEGHSYREILGLIKGAFPEASTNLNCLRWYAAKLRTKGQTVPQRVHGKTKS